MVQEGLPDASVADLFVIGDGGQVVGGNVPITVGRVSCICKVIVICKGNEGE